MWTSQPIISACCEASTFSIPENRGSTILLDQTLTSLVLKIAPICLTRRKCFFDPYSSTKSLSSRSAVVRSSISQLRRSFSESITVEGFVHSILFAIQLVIECSHEKRNVHRRPVWTPEIRTGCDLEISPSLILEKPAGKQSKSQLRLHT